TSPIPPAPIAPATSYDPILVPALTTIDPSQLPLGISPAGSRSAHARKAAQLRPFRRSERLENFIRS
ncbi:MAG TPA: hypothetical protein VFI95_24000, partial [Terriglobales bacterium]|nr:hypothetical protein [Terriglobales bacterium]